MKYLLSIPLANYPDTRTHQKEFDNVLDCIKYIKKIIKGKIQDDWNCHIEEAVNLQKFIKNGVNVTDEVEIEDLAESFVFINDKIKEYNYKQMVDYVFYNYVIITKQCQ
jgi:hypothetical protein